VDAVHSYLLTCHIHNAHSHPASAKPENPLQSITVDTARLPPDINSTCLPDIGNFSEGVLSNNMNDHTSTPISTHLSFHQRLSSDNEMASKHHIIALDSWVAIPSLSIPGGYSLTVITDGTALTNPSQLTEATIAINSQVPVNAALLNHMPKLKLFVATGTGIDHIDGKALRERGVVFCKVPAQNTGSLALIREEMVDGSLC
jgi:hypothetical protein